MYIFCHLITSKLIGPAQLVCDQRATVIYRAVSLRETPPPVPPRQTYPLAGLPKGQGGQDQGEGGWGRVRSGLTLDPNTRHPASLFQSLARTHTHPRAVCHGPDRRYWGAWGAHKGRPKNLLNPWPWPWALHTHIFTRQIHYERWGKRLKLEDASTVLWVNQCVCEGSVCSLCEKCVCVFKTNARWLYSSDIARLNPSCYTKLLYFSYNL